MNRQKAWGAFWMPHP